MRMQDAISLAGFMELNRNDLIIPRGIDDKEWLKWREAIDEIIDEMQENVRNEVYLFATSKGIELKDWHSK